MTKKRTEYLYQLTGTIQSQKPKKASSKSKYAHQPYYVLTVNLEKPYEHIKTIQIFPSRLTNPKIWTTIQPENYQQKYTFYCRNQKGYYYLINLEVIK